MHSLTINWILPGANLSGGTKSNRLIAEAMVRRGHKVNLAFIALPNPWPKVWKPRRLLHRIKYEIATRKTKHHLEQSSAKLIPVMDRVIKPEHVPNADVTIATWWETREWIDNWPDEKGLKAYFIRGHELHGGDPERVKNTYRMKGLKLVISSWLQGLMADEYGDPNSILIPNGIDRDQFDSPARGKQTVPTVGFLYGIQEIKGAATAFSALRHVQRRFPNLRTIAFGSTPVSRNHKPLPNLEFHLRPNQNEIRQLYRQTDCWIVPSTTEGFGMPGLEAAACHCPIVSTKCGGPKDFVKDGLSGFMVPVGNAEAISNAVCKVLELSNNQWRAMSRAGYNISKQFDWNRSAAKLEKALLRSVAESTVG